MTIVQATHDRSIIVRMIVLIIYIRYSLERRDSQNVYFFSYKLQRTLGRRFSDKRWVLAF